MLLFVRQEVCLYLCYLSPQSGLLFCIMTSCCAILAKYSRKFYHNYLVLGHLVRFHTVRSEFRLVPPAGRKWRCRRRLMPAIPNGRLQFGAYYSCAPAQAAQLHISSSIENKKEAWLPGSLEMIRRLSKVDVDFFGRDQCTLVTFRAPQSSMP